MQKQRLLHCKGMQLLDSLTIFINIIHLNLRINWNLRNSTSNIKSKKKMKILVDS
jgi:hypothetical protein